MKLTTHFLLVPRLRISGAIPLLLLYASWREQGKNLLCFTLHPPSYQITPPRNSEFKPSKQIKPREGHIATFNRSPWYNDAKALSKDWKSVSVSTVPVHYEGTVQRNEGPRIALSISLRP
jgi:hypothetical protein